MGPKYLLTRSFILRTTGFPVELIDSLASTKLARIVDQALAARKSCGERCRALLASSLDLSRNERRKLKRCKLPKSDAEALTLPELAELRLLFAHETSLHQEATELYRQELEQARKQLYGIVMAEPFQHVLLLSSPRLGRFTPEDAAPPAVRNSHVRQRELSWISYLQRLTTKNETISFFGPCAWGKFDDQQAAAARIEISDPAVEARVVYVERWVCEKLAAQMSADPELQPLLPLRLADLAMRLEDGAWSVSGKPLALSPAEQEFLERVAVSEVRGAGALAQSLIAMKVLIREIVIPPDPLPFHALQKSVASLPFHPAKTKWQERLAEIEKCRQAIECAVELEARRSAIHAMNLTLARLGINDNNRLQTLYASRLPINEDCRLGTQRLALGKPLMEQLLEDAAPWYDLWRDIAGLYATRLHECMRQACRGLDQDAIPLPKFWPAIMQAQQILPEIEAEIQQAWHKQIGERCGAPLVCLTEDDTAFVRNHFHFRRMKAFDNISPDMQIVASDAQALSNGDWNLLLAEIHPDFTAWQHCFFAWCPDREAYARDYAGQGGQGRAVVLGRFPPYFSSAHTSLWVYPYSHEWSFVGAPGAAGTQSLRSVDALVRITEDDVLMTDSGGRVLGSFLYTWQTALNTHRLELRGNTVHSSRLQVGRVIVQRESWLVEPDQSLCDAAKAGSYKAFAAIREFRAQYGLPEQVFVRACLPHRLTLDKDIKPVFVDFRNPLLAEMLAKMLPRVKKLLITEMLPKTEDCWLRDASGHHTCEFRTVILASRDSRQTDANSNVC